MKALENEQRQTNFSDNLKLEEEDSMRWVFHCHSFSVKADLRHAVVWPRVAKILTENLLSLWSEEIEDRFRARDNIDIGTLGLGENLKGSKQKSRAPKVCE